MPGIQSTITTTTDPAAVWEFLCDFRSTGKMAAASTPSHVRRTDMGPSRDPGEPSHAPVDNPPADPGSLRRLISSVGRRTRPTEPWLTP